MIDIIIIFLLLLIIDRVYVERPKWKLYIYIAGKRNPSGPRVIIEIRKYYSDGSIDTFGCRKIFHWYKHQKR